MQDVSDRFLAALRKPHGIRTTAEYQVPGGDVFPLLVKGGSVSVDDGARIRRKAQLKVYGTTADYKRMTIEGCLFTVRHGVNFGGNDTELVPVITGEIVSASRPFGRSAGEVTLPLQDLGAWLARTEFVLPYVVAAGTARTQAIKNLVVDARPSSVVSDLAGAAGGYVGVDRVFTGSRLDAITQLATDGGLESYWGADGTYIIRTARQSTDSSVWSTAGTLISAERMRPQDKLYNTVIVSPSATDGSQTWTPVVVTITDPSHPRHPSKIGTVPYRVASPTILTSADAYNVAVNRLDKVLGTTETLRLGTISNPALEGGDVIRVTTPPLNNEPADTFQHFCDGLSLDLDTGAMRLDTRSQRAA